MTQRWQWGATWTAKTGGNTEQHANAEEAGFREMKLKSKRAEAVVVKQEAS